MNKLDRRLQELGLSNRKAAKKAKCSHVTICLARKDPPERMLSIPVAMRVADAFALSLEDLPISEANKRSVRTLRREAVRLAESAA